MRLIKLHPSWIATFLFLTLIIYLALLLRPPMAYSEAWARRMLFDLRFCSRIPGAASVDHTGGPTARHCLVHIRQIHPTDDMSPTDTRKVRDIQMDIYDIVKFFVAELGLHEVYEEGITDAPQYDPGSISRRDLGACRQLLVEGKIRLKAAEIRESAQRARAAAELPNWEEDYLAALRDFFHWTMEEREDALLELIHRAGDRIALTVYGAGHDWRDNVKSWNQRHPEEPFALIEITPASYDSSPKKTGQRLINRLLYDLEHAEREDRLTAARALGEYGRLSVAIAGQLLRAREDSDPRLQEVAGFALEKLHRRARIRLQSASRPLD